MNQTGSLVYEEHINYRNKPIDKETEGLVIVTEQFEELAFFQSDYTVEQIKTVMKKSGLRSLVEKFLEVN